MRFPIIGYLLFLHVSTFALIMYIKYLCRMQTHVRLCPHHDNEARSVGGNSQLSSQGLWDLLVPSGVLPEGLGGLGHLVYKGAASPSYLKGHRQ